MSDRRERWEEDGGVEAACDVTSGSYFVGWAEQQSSWGVGDGSNLGGSGGAGAGWEEQDVVERMGSGELRGWGGGGEEEGAELADGKGEEGEDAEECRLLKIALERDRRR